MIVVVMRSARLVVTLAMVAGLVIALLAACAGRAGSPARVTPGPRPVRTVQTTAAPTGTPARPLPGSATAAATPEQAATVGLSVTADPLTTATPAAPPTDTPPPAPTAAITLLRGPYLQSVTAGSAAVVWTTAEDGPAELAVTGPDGSERRVAAESARRDVAAPAPYDRYTLHVARVDGLQPAGEYRYRIFTAGAELDLDRPHVLRTAPESGELRFIVFGDSGTGSSEQQALRDLMREDTFDFALVAGDVAYQYGSYEQFERYFFDIYDDLLTTHPFWPVPGNHDYLSDAAGPFLDLFVLPENAWRESDRERYYSFDWGDAHIVGLDTEAPFYNLTADPDEDMAEWLAADLAASDKPWKLVFLHRSPYSSGPHAGDERVQERLVPVFEAGGVDVVFSGHDHVYERTVPLRGGAETTLEDGGILYIVTGGGGAPRYAFNASWFTAFGQSVNHYTRVTIAGCELRLRAVTVAGEVIDTATVARDC
jgi:predicted phosphodiesterase